MLPHVEQIFVQFAEAFLSFVTIENVFVYGDRTSEIRAILDTFDVRYFASFNGFTR